MTKIKKEMLISTAEELNVLFFGPNDPQIDTKQEQEVLEDNIREAMELFSPDDDLTDGTIETLQEMLKVSHKGLSAKTANTLRELGIWKDEEKPKAEPEPEPEPEEDTPKEVEPKKAEAEKVKEDATIKETDLVAQIQNAPRLRDLKKIAKAYDELKSVRSEMSRHKTADDLRKVMLAVLRGRTQEELKPESKPVTEKVPEKKEEKKTEPKSIKTKQKKPGVITSIISIIEESGKKGVTKDKIQTQLKELFPDRNEESMRNTINVQVPNRITKERFPVEKLENGCYRKKI